MSILYKLYYNIYIYIYTAVGRADVPAGAEEVPRAVVACGNFARCYMYMYMYVYAYTYLYVCVYVYVYVYACVYIFIYIHVCVWSPAGTARSSII